MTVNQISIFLENKYGKLSEILALLAEERIRIIAATVADTSEYGILRIIVSDPQKAYKILKENNVSANLTDVLAIVTSSCAGSFANTLSYFTKAGISIEYMYCFSIREKAILILRTNNRESAREVIRRQNLEYMFGISDPGIWLAYLLAFACLLFSIWFGITTWNKEDDEKTNPTKESRK